MEEHETTITMTASEFEQGVAMAAQSVAAVHRKRLVAWGFIAGLAATAAVALPSLFFAAKANCHSITKLGVAQEEGFVEGIASRKRFLRESTDRFGLRESQFQALLRRSDESQRKQLRAIREVAHTDCRYL